MRWGKLGLLGLALAITLGGVGCGSGPKLVKVKGKVTLDGEPLAGGMVIFYPQAPGGHQANAVTESDGSFSLTTFSTGDGAIPGDYKVLVKYQEPTTEDELQLNQAKPDIKGMMEKFQKIQKEKVKRPPKYVVPARYSTTDKTPFTQRVPADGPVNLELKSK